MISVVIIEDEKVIREGLEKHVPWKRLGVDRVYTAQQAEQAFEICEKEQPDLIVSDIRMPGMNGIEMCRKIREKYPACQIIFVTGFSDKEYLKAAIELHAVSYVEKPVNVTELSKAVTDALEEVRKKRANEKAILYSAFTKSDKIEYNWTDDKYFRVALLRFRQVTDREKAVILYQKIEATAKQYELHVRQESLNEITDGFLLSMKYPSEDAVKLVEDELKQMVMEAEIPCFLAWGMEVCGQEKIKDAYESAMNVQSHLGFLGWNHTSDEKRKTGEFSKIKLMTDWRAKFTQAVTHKEKDAAVRIVEEITEDLKKNQSILSEEVRHLYYVFHDILEHFGGGSSGKESDIPIQTLDTLDELEAYICGQIQKEDKEQNKNSFIIEKVNTCILQHFQEKDLSIKTLADQVYLTPTYLSNLYKKYTGMTIGQYLVDVRISHAIEYLKDPQWKLYQIAPMVGYEDSNYFAKIFKKKTGITPSEYREKTGTML